MSMESAELFIDRMNCDEVFAEQVATCKNSHDRMSFVKTAGFCFTPAEIKLVRNDFIDHGRGREKCNIVQGPCRSGDYASNS